MTTAAKRVLSTPMAPYMGLMREMKVNDMYFVIEFLKEAIREAEEANRKAEDDFLSQKMAEINVSPETHELVEWLRLTPDEATDERTRYILGER